MNMKRSLCIFAIAMIAAFTASLSIARTWYVKADGTGDAPTIQAGIDSAATGDTVLVASGTYTSSVDVSIEEVPRKVNVYLNKNILLTAEEPFHKAVLDLTGIDGAVYIDETYAAVLRGFKIQGQPRWPDWSGSGPSVYCGSGCTIELNRIENNWYGTGIYIQDDSLDPKYLRHNLLLHNYAGVHVCGAKVTVENNTIFSDTATEFGVSVFFSPECAADLLIQNNILVWGDRAVDCYPSCDPSAYSIRCNAIYETILDTKQTTSIAALDASNFELGAYGDPQFCGAAADNFYLQSDSPCAPGNHPRGYDCGYIGAYPVNCGTTPTKMKTWGSIKDLYR